VPRRYAEGVTPYRVNSAPPAPAILPRRAPVPRDDEIGDPPAVVGPPAAADTPSRARRVRAFVILWLAAVVGAALVAFALRR
jgi:hypothetical protein